MHPFQRIFIHTALVFSLAACASPGAQTEPSTSLAWNRIAHQSIERSKIGQHLAIRLFTQLSLAQHAAIRSATDSANTRDAVAAASMKVITELLPVHTEFVAAQYRAQQVGQSEAGLQAAQKVLAAAAQDGFTRTASSPPPPG